MKKALPVYRTHPFQPLAGIMTQLEKEFNRLEVPAIRLKLMPYDFVMLRDPDLFRKVLQDNQMGLRKNTDDLWRFRWIMPKGGTVNPGTPDCLKRKRRILKPFAEPSLSYYMECLPPIFEQFITQWNQNPDAFEAKNEAAKLVVASTFRMFFSKSLAAEQLNDISHKIEFIHSNFFSHLPEWVPTPNKYRFMKYGTQMRALFLEFLNERRASGSSEPDLIGHFQHLSNDDGTPYEDAEIVDEICSKYFGSTAMTSSTAWLIYWLAANPQALEKAREEVLLAGESALSGTPDLSKLPYCRMIAKEVLRLTPTFWSIAPRTATTLEHPDYEIPSGSKLLLSMHHLHRNAAYWQHPDSFFPDHFQPETEKNRDLYAYLPFSKGSRACVGQNISFIFLQLLVAAIAARSKIEHLPSKPHYPRPVVGFETLPNEVRVRFTSYAN